MSLSIFLNGAEIVGSYGMVISDTGYWLFGYVIYALPFPLFYFVYKLYKNFIYTQRKLEVFSAFLLTLIGLLIFQDIATNYKISVIGSAFIDFFFPVIGTVGISIIIIGLFAISFFIILDTTIDEIVKYLNSIKKTPINIVREFESKKEAKNTKKNSFDGEFEQEKKKKSDISIDAEDTVSSYLVKKIEELIPIDEESIKEDIEIKRKLYVTLQNSRESRNIESKKDHEAISEIKDIVKTIEEKDESEEEIEEDDSYIIESPTYQDSLNRKNEVTIVSELEENKKLLESIEKGEQEKPKNFVLPKIEFLEEAKKKKKTINEDEIDAKIQDLLEKLRMFKIEGDVIRTYSGPVVTTFEFRPAPHIKVSKILSLQDDIAMALKALTIRIQAPIPGKDVVGIEIPNDSVETIYLRDVLESEIFEKASSPLTIALGKDIVGNPFITDLKKLPHLLIAGTTGSGKSVGINAMILSLLYRNSPDDLKLLMVDPKMLEFSIYNDIPHLLTPVITKPKQAISALSNMVKEMERRYYMMSQTKTKNIENYNEKAKNENRSSLPYIVVIIDELADLMMTGGKDVEVSIARLAQMARASGIHLIIATQRPSVDVITGIIKANLPSRISYRVGSKIDSKVILDGMGAESLLGRGDMLFTPPGSVGLVRLHAPWSSEPEIEKVVDFLKAQRPADYDHSFLDSNEDGFSPSSGGGGSGGFDEELDELYEEAKEIVLNEKKTSISYLQRRLQIGYNRSARIVEQLEKTGVLTEQNSKGQRDIVG